MNKKIAKLLSFILSFVLVISLLPNGFVFAATDVKISSTGEYIYNQLKDGTINLLGFQKNKASIDIPEQIDGYTVTRIDAPIKIDNPLEGFGYFGQENTILTSVILPETLTYLGDNVFEHCSALKSVYIPQSVYYIGCWAFYECESLEHIAIPESCTRLGDAAFYGCSSLSSITFGSNISYIGPAAFEGCTSLASVNIPESITEISDYVFADCRNLEICNIPSKVERIGVEAFRNCTKLQDFDIPETTVEIDFDAFSGSGYDDINNWDGDLLYLDNWLIASTPFIQGEVVIKEGTVGIAGRVFAERYAITDVDLPDSLKYIVEYAFKDIYSYICNYYEGVYYLENWALSSYSPNNAVTLLDGTVGIASGAFQYLYLREITLPESLKYIGSYAFCLCEELTTVNMAPVVYIGAGAFQYCEALEEIILPQSLEYLGHSAFWSTALTEITLPQGLAVVQPLTFGACDNFKKIVFSKNIKKIYFDAFWDCEALNEIYFDGTEQDWNNIIIEDGNESFKNANLYYIDAAHTHTWDWVIDKEPTCSEKGLKHQKCTYVGCSATQNITEIDATNEHNFEWVIDKSATCVEDGNKHEECTVCHIKQNENTIISTSGKHEYENGSCVYCNVVDTKDFALGLNSDGSITIMDYSGIATNIVLPEYINVYVLTRIENGTFQNKSLIRSISIPKSVTSIGDSAFRNCIGLETVYYSGTIEEWNEISIAIDNDCLISATIICSNGTINGAYDYIVKDDGTLEITGYRGQNIYITIPSKIGDITVTSIANNAFENSTIQSVIIPDTVSVIKRGTFDGCRNLKRIDFGNGVTEIEDYSFTNTDLNYVSIGDSVEKIGPNAFSHHIESLSVSENNKYFTVSDGVLFSKDKSKLVFYLTSSYRDSYYIPNTVTEICDYAFRNATWLYEVEFSENIKKIGSGVFADCVNITEIKLNTGLEEIGASAFSNCKDLFDITIPNTVSIIGIRAFSFCKSISSIVIPEGITCIDFHTFYACETLENITIPSSITSIGDVAFERCNSLTDVYYLGSDEDWTDVSISESGNECLFNANIHFASTSHQHSWEWVIDRAATCGTSGVKHEFCEGCSKVRNENTEILPTRNHTFCWITDEEATCSEVGIKHEECSGCHIKRSMNTVIPATNNHDYADATCTSPKTCKVCGVTSGDKLSHKSDAGTVTQKATCTSTGMKTYKCTLCKATIKTDTIAKVAHKYDSGVVTKKATCKATGVKIYTCSVCKGTKTETISKSTSHTYSNNCDKSCNVCGKIRTVGAHKYSNSCDTTCNYCSAKRTIKHTYTNSCDTKCNVCSATRTITHAYKTTTTKATLTKNGSIVKKCTVCAKVASKSTIKYAKTFKLSTTSYTYDAKVKSPTVTVKDSAGKILKKNTHYTVTYANGRKNVGTYKVTIKMIGKYSGTKTLTFKINPAKTTVSKLTAGKKSITVAITKKSTQVTGYQIQYSISKTFSKATTKTISSFKTTKYTLKSLGAKKTYYVRVRTYKTVGKTKYYSGWSTYKYVKTK